MRRHIMERLAGAGRRVEDIEMAMDTLYRAEELFLTNWVTMAWVDGRDLPVGALGRRLLKDLADAGVIAGPAEGARP